MDSRRVHSLTTHVPTITNAHARLYRNSTFAGANARGLFAFFCVVPLFMYFDQNGGLMTLGFGTAPTVEQQFKMRPDYVTGKMFGLTRVEMHTFKQLA